MNIPSIDSLVEFAKKELGSNVLIEIKENKFLSQTIKVSDLELKKKFYVKNPVFSYYEADTTKGLEFLSQGLNFSVVKVMPLKNGRFKNAKGFFITESVGDYTLSECLKKKLECKDKMLMNLKTFIYNFGLLQMKSFKELENFKITKDKKIPKKFLLLIEEKDWILKNIKNSKELKDNIMNMESKIIEIEKKIPLGIVHNDFHLNNIVYDFELKKLTMIDCGEVTVSMPYLSFINFCRFGLFQGLENEDVDVLKVEYLKSFSNHVSIDEGKEILNDLESSNFLENMSYMKYFLMLEASSKSSSWNEKNKKYLIDFLNNFS